MTQESGATAAFSTARADIIPLLLAPTSSLEAIGTVDIKRTRTHSKAGQSHGLSTSLSTQLANQRKPPCNRRERKAIAENLRQFARTFDGVTAECDNPGAESADFV